MKKTILFLLCLITGSFAFSQDVIYRFSEYELATIRAKVIKVTPEVVEYKDVNQPNGHVKSIKIKDVYMIVYQDGRKEVFNGKAGKSGAGQEARRKGFEHGLSPVNDVATSE